MANIDNVQLPDGSSYNIVDNTSGFATQNYVNSAVSSVTKTTIGLGNVDNTSDLNKPISTATQTALDTLDEEKADKTDIATVESGTTASRAYSVGELVYVSGTLYSIKVPVASGATFTVGTNIEVTNVSNAIEEINAKIDKGSVSVTADGTKNYATLLQQLYLMITSSKLTPTSYLKMGGTYYRRIASYMFGNDVVYPSSVSMVTVDLATNKFYSGTIRSTGLTITEDSSAVPTTGFVIELVY